MKKYLILSQIYALLLFPTLSQEKNDETVSSLFPISISIFHGVVNVQEQ